MRPSAKTVWFSAVVGAISLAIAPINVGFAIQWGCLWFGLAVFFIGARQRFPMFTPLAPPASLSHMGIPAHTLTGAVTSPWYVIVLVGALWLCVMGLPLLMPEVSLLPFAILIVPALLGGAAFLFASQRGPVKIAKRLLAKPAPDERRIVGVVKNDEPGLTRDTFWFGIEGVHYGTTEVDDIYGERVTVMTATPTSNTYGYRQERRGALRVEADGVEVVVDARMAWWAAPAVTTRSAPKLDTSALGGSWAVGYVQGAKMWECEKVGRGQRVVALGIWDAEAGTLRGERSRPLVLFATGRDGDPRSALRLELWRRRWPMVLLGLTAAASVLAALLIAPPAP